MLAVLPFVNLSGDPAQDYFVDAMTEEMITAVAKAQQLRTALKQRGPRGYWEQELVFAAAPENPPEFLTGAFGRALLYAQLWEEKEATAALEQAFTEHDWRLTEIGVEPLLQPIRGNDQFMRLERKAGLPTTKVE